MFADLQKFIIYAGKDLYRHFVWFVNFNIRLIFSDLKILKFKQT